MKKSLLFSVITPNYNGEAYLESTIRSVLAQRQNGIELEYIVVDGMSTDSSLSIIEKYSNEIDRVIVEKDTGPANAINKGFRAATGDVVSWLNADDVYYPGALHRIQSVMTQYHDISLCFGACPIIDLEGNEIRRWITKFKELFFPISGRFTIQCINYISQPATFFRREAVKRAGFLKEDMVAAWDYDFILRLWQQGRVLHVKGPPISAFRWHEASIGGSNFHIQFKEELECVIEYAGAVAPQTLIHHGVRWGIIGAYSLMAFLRKFKNRKAERSSLV